MDGDILFYKEVTAWPKVRMNSPPSLLMSKVTKTKNYMEIKVVFDKEEKGCLLSFGVA